MQLPGGAPANVAVAAARLGAKVYFISKLRADVFGDFLEETLRKNAVDTTFLYRTNLAKTALAFVSLDKNGERDFSFYRNPSADMLLDHQEIS